MYKRYFRWEKAPYGAEAIEWVEMTSKEFYSFVNSPMDQERHFLKANQDAIRCTLCTIAFSPSCTKSPLGHGKSVQFAELHQNRKIPIFIGNGFSAFIFILPIMEPMVGGECG